MSMLDWKSLMQSADEAGSSFDPCPAGEYDVELMSANAKQASTGKDMIECRFRVESGPYEGKSIWNNFTLTRDNPNALRFFFMHMNALGLTSAFFAQQPSLDKVADSLMGRRAVVRVSIREFGGVKRNQVDAVLPPRNPAPTGLPDGGAGGLGQFESGPPKIDAPDLPF